MWITKVGNVRIVEHNFTDFINAVKNQLTLNEGLHHG